LLILGPQGGSLYPYARAAARQPQAHAQTVPAAEPAAPAEPAAEGTA
jgi:hypothetical protein